MTRALGLVALLLLAVPASAQQIVKPTQTANPNNKEVTSGVAAAVSVTLIPGSRSQVRLYAFSGRCSAGSAGFTITDGGVQTWSSDTGLVTTSQTGVAYITPYTGGVGKTVVLTLGSCGGGNTGTLNYQADVY